MKIPEKLKVGAVTYDVAHVNDIRDSSGMLLGRIDYVDQEIELLDRGGDDARMQTFFHEMVHAIHHHTATDQETCPPDERDVDALASALLMVVKDNPELFCAYEVIGENAIYADNDDIPCYVERKIKLDGVVYTAQITAN